MRDCLAPSDRARLAERVRGLKESAAAAVTEAFYSSHPEWVERYGQRGRDLTRADTASHVEFLAAALVVGKTGAFVEYVLWTRRVLEARGIGADVLAEGLFLLGQSLAAGLPDEEDRGCVAAFLQVGVDACLVPLPPAAPSLEEGPLAGTRAVFLKALLSGQRAAAANIALEALAQGHATLEIYTEVLQEALYEVGRLWERNRITVAEEHMATTITTHVLSLLYATIPAGDELRGRAVITDVQDELHQVGAHMVADALDADGWDTRFLGTNMPHSGIVQAVADHHADVLGISVTMLTNIPRATRLITTVRERLGPHAPRIVVGGAAFGRAPALWQEIGADGYAPDLRGAVDLLRAVPVP